MFDVRAYDSVGSTNDEARLLAQAGAAHGTVVTAREQTAGRGRVGRSWASPEGNLYLSVLLRLGMAPARLPELSFVASLAVADMVDGFLPADRRATLKWPNDVLVGGAKIAGILAEQAGEATILGIGVNVAHCPEGTAYPVTSLRAAADPSPLPPPARGGERGRPVEGTRIALLAALETRLGMWLARGFAPIRADWLARAHPLGTRLRADAIEGHFAGLDANGALLLDTKQGRRRVIAGDVQPR